VLRITEVVVDSSKQKNQIYPHLLTDNRNRCWGGHF